MSQCTAIDDTDRLRALNSYDVLNVTVEEALDGLVELAAETCEAPIGLITLVDEMRQLFKARVGYDGPAVAPLDVGFCPAVVQHGEPVIIPDTLADPVHARNAVTREGGIRFYAGVPLLTRERQVLGTLCVLDKAPRPGGLTERQLRVLQTLADQVVGHFELLRLLTERQATISERDVLAGVQVAIARAGGDLDTILAVLVASALQVVPAAEGGALALIEGETLNFRAAGGTLQPDKGSRIPLHGSLAGHCVGRNEALLIDDVRQDGRVPRDVAEQSKLCSAVLAPVMHGGQVLGVLQLQSSRSGAFDARDLQVARLFAGAVIAGLTEARAVEAQHAVAASAWRQQAILDSAVDFGIIGTDRAGFVTDWNTGAERILGWAADEMRGQLVDRIFTPEDRAIGRPDTEMRLALEQGRASDERWHVRRDNRRFWASGEMMPLRDGQEMHVGFLKILRDRTAEHRAGEALREAEAALQRAQAAGGVGVFSVNLADDMLKATPEFCRLYGVPVRDCFPSEEIERLVLRDGASLVSTPASRRLGEVVPDVEYRIRRADTGEVRWLSRRGEIERDGAGRPLRFVGVGRDITARKQIEHERDQAAAALRALTETLERQVVERTAELMVAEEQLRQAQKMEAVGQLTGGLAHDFNNLLTGIMGSLELMQKAIGQGRLKNLDRYVGAAQGAAKRAAALTHRLLAFSRRQTLDPRPTDVNRLIKGMEDLIRRTVGPAITVEVVGAADLWPTLVDPPQLENALLNLCINARDAMPGGGDLLVEAANRCLDEHAAGERDLPPGQYVTLSVSDSGTGMPPEVVAKAFDPFFTTKPLGQGTGLGLSMTYGFARQSGGQVRIRSEVGQGSTVSVYLPRHYGATEAAEKPAELQTTPHAEDGETVVVVDDEPTVRMLVTEVLGELGYSALEAADGASGLRLLQSDVRVDLLVTDVGLPGGMNGRQMAEAARLTRPDLKVLFITGFAEKAVVGNGHLERNMHVMTKPFAMEALASRIRELIKGR